MKAIFQRLLSRLGLLERQSFGGVFARVLQADTLRRSAEEMADKCSSGRIENYVHHRQRQGYATHI